MAILKDGFYKIRFVPDGSKSPDADVMYATGTKMRDPVKVEQSPNPQIWQIKQIDNTNYNITMEEDFRVAWSLGNPIYYSLQPSASAPGMVILDTSGEKFTLNPKDGVGAENTVYSMKVSSESPSFNNAVVTVIDKMVMVQSPSLVEPFIWKFEFVR